MEYNNPGISLILLLLFTQVFAVPAHSTLSMVVSSTEPSSAKEGTSQENVSISTEPLSSEEGTSEGNNSISTEPLSVEKGSSEENVSNFTEPLSSEEGSSEDISNFTEPLSSEEGSSEENVSNFTELLSSEEGSSEGNVSISSEHLSSEERTSEETVSSVKIYKMHVQSDISNRYANTTIISKVKNLGNKSQEATFSVILPETAFISGFIMEVDAKNYTAYVKEKEEAKRDYDQAVASGLGAAHIAVSTRDSNRFTVSVNIEPEKKAAFYLFYEQLLKRDDGHYEQVINLHPGQPVEDLSVEVVIKESRTITDLKTPPLRSGNEIGNDKTELDPRAEIEHVNGTSAVVKFTPDLERQKEWASLLGTKEDKGLSGQFIVQYDVERDPRGGEVLIQDGYFVHFFAPSELEPLPKHVVFVLDTSGSLGGDNIEQLREVMLKILDQLHSNDSFNLVEFNSNTKVWNLDNSKSSVWYPTNNDHDDDDDDEGEVKFDNFTFPNAYAANSNNIKKAKDTASKLEAYGGTDIYSALKVGLHLVELAKKEKGDAINRLPIIIFLTDGDPTNRLTSTEEIINKTSEFNSGPRKSAIFGISFGDDADKKFMEKLALRNSGFNKHIYAAADASLQLQDFYRQISSPLLSDVTFKYEPSVTSLTKTEFPIHFGGSELVVAGWCETPYIELPVIYGRSAHGRIHLQPTVEHSVSNIERLWAYLTVKQLLEKKEISDKNNDELKKKALDLALKYSFVTPVSSLVVVKPNYTNPVDTESAAGGTSGGDSYKNTGFAGHFSMLNGRGRWGISSFIGSSYDANFLGSNYNSVEKIEEKEEEEKEEEEKGEDKENEDEEDKGGEEAIKTKESAKEAKASDLLTTLPWLKNILNENGTLSLPSGKYKLGLNESLSDTVTCPKTPLNSAGHCTLLHSCPQVYCLLISSDVFVQHSCVLMNEFAGICCPD